MKLKLHILCAALLALAAGVAHAEPKNGFGVDGGLTNNSMSGNGTAGIITGMPVSYTSSGLSLGIDYQFAVTPNLSLNPFLMSSGEATSGMGSNVSAGHGILGLQLRYWADDVFFGGHLARYSEVLNNSNTGISINASGGGFGLVVGWGNPQGGLFVMGQYDAANFNYVDANIKLRGVRMSVGYRWK